MANNQEKSQFFSLMVVGDNPDELLKKYDSNLKLEPYIKYHYKDAGKLRKKSIKLMQDIIDNKDKTALNDITIDYFKERVNALKNMSDFDYYTCITTGLNFNKDGDAITTENPDGKYKTCRIGKNLCIPLKLKTGKEVLQAKAKDVDWVSMHLINQDVYKAAWELFHKEREPKTETEKTIYENVKNQNRYFENFDSEDKYVEYNCSYWNYAYLDEKGWLDADDHKNYEWITKFYDKFVKKLKPDDLVTIYECTKA